MVKHEELRQKYIPQAGNLNILFVAEAAPDTPERFFYNEDVATHDWLFLGLARALYKDAQDATTAQLREHKSDYLKRFQQNGYYLIDAIDDHLPVETSQNKRISIIRQNAEDKAREASQLIDQLGHESTNIILLKATVYQGLYNAFKNADLPLVQQGPIPFPSTGRQKQFRRAMSALIVPR